LKVRAHTCYLGKTGYAAHSRSFFRELSKYVELRVRNYTWDPNPDYINNQDLSIVDQITLSDNLGNRSTYPITQAFPHLDWKNSNNDFKQDIDIVLMEQNHAYFYEEYNSKIKIAYTVWESTLLENSFFRKLLEFDYLWVVTQWHKDCIIKQGFPSQRVFIVNEGVNSEFFKQVEKPAHITELHDGSFNFIFFNRWDYRKFAPEIISAFLKAFPNDEPVNLILSAENPYATDGFKTTSERLEHYGFFDERIKVKSFLERGDYVSWVKNAHVMITCARSEGWNIPLIEALASGTPALYSNWGAQLEFAAGLATPIKIEGELPANRGDYIGLGGEIPGLYCQPDKEDLVLKIRECYDNWSEKKEKALLEAEIIKQKFNWQKIGHDAFNLLGDILKKPPVNKYWFNINFVGGPFFSIDGYTRDEFLVEFIDNDSGQLIHSDKLNCGMWTRSFRRYYTNWLINVRNLKTGESTQHKFNLNGKKVLISIDSSSLGDSIAWFAPIQDFAKKHNCQIILSSFKNFLFKEQYPDIEFIEPGSYFENVYASYNIGWYYDSNGDVDLNMNPTNFRMQPLQKVTTDILGMDYIPTKPKLKTELGERPIAEPYVCFAIHSTAQAKYWNNSTGWQELTDYFISLGKKVVILSREGNGYMGNLYPIGSFEPEGGKDLENTMRYLKYCDIFVGVSSGLSWLSWAMNIPTVIISGFSLPFSEVEDDNVIRVFKTGVCNGCFNRHKLDSGDWNWCPDK
jgi:autotransporter strand-loop-strand O-heptosyltransferase